jgi:hypothetical protein
LPSAAAAKACAIGKSKRRITVESSAQSIPPLPNAPVLRPTRTGALFGPDPRPEGRGLFILLNARAYTPLSLGARRSGGQPLAISSSDSTAGLAMYPMMANAIP